MTFTLPPAHATWLTRAAGPDNLAVQAQYVGLLAEVEDDILGCFRDGGGVGYAAFPRFQALMAEDSGAVHDATLIEVTLPLVTGLVERLRSGIDVADVGCGSGHAVNLMGAAFPASRFVGFDVSDTGLGAATAEAHRRGLTNVHFVHKDAASLDGTERFDLITTFDAVHDQAARTWCSPASRSRCGPAGSTCAWTSPRPARWPTTSTTRSGRSCTPSPACTA